MMLMSAPPAPRSITSHVGGDPDRPSAGPAEVKGAIRCVLGACIDRNVRRTCLRQTLGDAAADVRAGSGRHLVFQHIGSPRGFSG